MKTIKIAHLYYDILNLYGENGNVRYLKRKLESLGLKTEVHFLSMEDEIDFKKYDFYYVGAGTDANKEIVLENILKYKKEIAESIEDNKYFLVTGNAYDLFGKGIQKMDGSFLEALDVFDYTSMEEEFRIIEDQYYSCDLIPEKILGFQNRSTVSTPSGDALFEVVKGTGSNPAETVEGIHYKNFFGTYLVGPILVRNPYFTDYLAKKICEENGASYSKPNLDDLSYKAYREFIKNFYSGK